MGTYLSTPVTEKGQESGEQLENTTVPCRWGVVDMQGWRKSMEDSHVAQTDVMENGSLKVFGVFDGHGGPEVARFVQLYLVDVLLHQGKEMPEKEIRDENTGDVLKATFHALDRMIDQEERRDELLQLRTDKPGVGEMREVGSIPIPPATGQPIQVLDDDGLSGHIAIQEEDEPHVTSMEEVNADKEMEQVTAGRQGGDVEVEEVQSAEEAAREPENDSPAEEQDVSAMEEASAESEESSDADSDEAVGLEEASKLDQDLMNGTDDGDDQGTAGKKGPVDVDCTVDDNDGSMPVAPESPRSRKVAGMFKFLNLKGKKGQVAAKVDKKAETTSSPGAGQPTESFRASVIQNGRPICNLRDHPIHAGCTAVVAVLNDRTLTVANAGDSRAVLCRVGGKTEPLSFDHKPQQDRELSRIRRAGGFVNQFGRVNGNLNLSRSIGDLKYKQVPGIPPAEQMITAEPDIIQTTLHSQDEFIILGCDGIWDCLTNEQAVHYVRDRIDTKTPTQIGIEMLDEIISEDPRATQGIGGDNMTVMIIDLQPGTRSYALKAET